MSKISVSFLVGFALVAGAGAASAGGADAAAMSNSVASQVMSMDGMQASARLSETKATNPLAQAASSLTGAPAGSGTGVDIPSVQAKIGSGTNLSLPGNALMDAASGTSGGVANALQGTQASADDGLKSTVVLGSNMGDVSNMIGEDMRSQQRLGK
ncbi:hypothetical protein [Enterovirga sp.]|uniref:hypothetical protein n=1 Tax=Enterovirga sp. TaxID=2026350 RepID=UPI002B8F25B8|nr:hypothetical protein [Enterovirga sp.]HMO30131.1 hypothetical protein [Enterovirga sp.]